MACLTPYADVIIDYGLDVRPAPLVQSISLRS
jgi:hypothetical protein